MDSFINSMVDSTYDGDMIAYEPITEKLDSVIAI